MKKILFMFIVIVSASCGGQIIVGNFGVQYVAAAPFGACSSYAPIQVVVGTGAIYSCQSGVWADVTSGSAGSGTVTSVAGLSPLFSVTNPTTNVTFTQDFAAANTVFGNFTGSAAAPTFSNAPIFSAANLTNFPLGSSSIFGVLQCGSGTTCTNGVISVAGTSSGFPIVLGTTSLAASSTTTALAGLTVDGVSPTTFGFLDATSSIQNQLNAKSAIASPTFTGIVSTPALTVSGITGSTQCLQVNTSGVVSGTGTACGSGGGAVSSVFSRTGAVTAQTGDYASFYDAIGAAAAAQAAAETFSSNASNISSGTLAAARVATLNQSTTGNAATATNISTNGTANQVWGMNSGASAQGWQTVSGGITGLTTGFLPAATSATAIGNSHVDDGVTNTGTVTSSEPIAINCTSCASQFGLTYMTGFAPAVGTSTTALFAPNTSGQATFSEAGAAYSRVCLAGNSVCDLAGAAAAAVAAIPQASASTPGLVECGTGTTCTAGVMTVAVPTIAASMNMLKSDNAGNAVSAGFTPAAVIITTGNQTMTGVKTFTGSITTANLTDSALTAGDLVLAGTAGLLSNGPTITAAAAHTFLGNSTGSAATMTATLLGASDLTSDYIAGGGTAQAQTATLAPAATALVAGLKVYWKPTAANTAAAPTLAVNALTATSITKAGGTALAAGDLSTTAVAFAIYDGTNFELQNPQTLSSGGTTHYYTSTTFTGIGPTTFTPTHTLDVFDATATTGNTQEVVQAGAGQSTDIFDVYPNGLGNPYFYIQAFGQAGFAKRIVSVNGFGTASPAVHANDSSPGVATVVGGTGLVTGLTASSGSSGTPNLITNSYNGCSVNPCYTEYTVTCHLYTTTSGTGNVVLNLMYTDVNGAETPTGTTMIMTAGATSIVTTDVWATSSNFTATPISYYTTYTGTGTYAVGCSAQWIQ